MRILSSLAVGVAVTSILAGVGSGVGAAAARQKIAPDQHFIGLVNGSNDAPIVFTVCAGASSSRGRVAGGQTVSVAQVVEGTGFTGPLNQVFAWFEPTKSGATPRQLKFAAYGRPRVIPPTVRVPCEGNGTVAFSPCPYLAPCANGWIADEVAVRFVDIAASGRVPRARR